MSPSISRQKPHTLHPVARRVFLQRGTLQAVTSDPCLKTPALPHDGGLQPQAEAATAGSAPEEALQALGTHMAEGDGLGLLRLAKKGLSQRNPR